ncbi:YpdA family putative bacillithiol disulfide reductase [Halalkalibacterium halodurans]|uniref:YpdA family putative bacillithiol disulfide reductase n=1 Tax=Halalkalibacterium halodurans TaxID=86665 RepID=UPI001067D4FD|nr:YpdA family putative bacillithiol disulfide reductase [Halalkalibacterium halodurans]MDY7222195.1 YpdA family putative bacillithiol disulfide reductase [Halalkalibacterium halodurans]MDY7241416.1 YpdA family putative bacillithiol disulfide reductase [Halalkalibacterium halodurans]MED4081804.1 YpdA family putative bacillithiol disulfide reductase [Halalkalibacterium halodurans]MED4086459.1 YpdA family putative bacillithiol disulfide reductase [Halalkalibacterium halodurans]MED4105005.1 YpdA 
MEQEQVIIVGGGPCGLAAAIALQNEGLKPLVIEKDNIVSAIHRYPTHQTFFSTSEKLEIGQVPFLTEERKPKRSQALVYYREVVKRKQIRVNPFERVTKVTKQEDGTFYVVTSKRTYHCKQVVIATGYYDHPNSLGVPGEDLPHVFHYFKEAHPYFDQDVVVIGGKNSAVDAALELEKAGARVTVLYRGDTYSDSVKPWILPEFVSLVNHDKVKMVFRAQVKRITASEVEYETQGERKAARADFVFAMIGYHPDHNFLKTMGVAIDHDTGRPIHDPETMETNVEGIFIAGVIAAGNNANEIFIENGRFHGEMFAKLIRERVE